MPAKKMSPDIPLSNDSESPILDIKPERNPLIERIVANLAKKRPQDSEEKLRAATRDILMYITQEVMEGKEVILGDILIRPKPDKDSPEAKGPRPGQEHLFHIDVEYTPPKIPGASKDSFPMSLPPNLLTKH